MEVENDIIKVQVVFDINVDFIKDSPRKCSKGRKTKPQRNKGRNFKKKCSKEFDDGIVFQDLDERYVTVPIYSEYHPSGISGYAHISKYDENWENVVHELENRAYLQDFT